MSKQSTDSPPDRYDVAVVGAGPAGGSAASALATAGWRVALIERKDLPHHKVCGEFLSPEAQATLRALGLYETLAALAPTPLTGATLTSRRGATLTMNLPGTAWGLSRYAMDVTLANAAVARGAALIARRAALYTRAVIFQPVCIDDAGYPMLGDAADRHLQPFLDRRFARRVAAPV